MKIIDFNKHRDIKGGSTSSEIYLYTVAGVLLTDFFTPTISYYLTRGFRQPKDFTGKISSEFDAKLAAQIVAKDRDSKDRIYSLEELS